MCNSLYKSENCNEKIERKCRKGRKLKFIKKNKKVLSSVETCTFLRIIVIVSNSFYQTLYYEVSVFNKHKLHVVPVLRITVACIHTDVAITLLFLIYYRRNNIIEIPSPQVTISKNYFINIKLYLMKINIKCCVVIFGICHKTYDYESRAFKVN